MIRDQSLRLIFDDLGIFWSEPASNVGAIKVLERDLHSALGIYTESFKIFR